MVGAATDPRASIVFWSLVLFALVIAGYFVVSLVKKHLKTPDEVEGPGAGFTLADLRELHRTGQMSTEEYERAKGRMVASAKSAMQRDASEAMRVKNPPRQN